MFCSHSSRICLANCIFVRLNVFVQKRMLSSPLKADSFYVSFNFSFTSFLYKMVFLNRQFQKLKFSSFDKFMSLSCVCVREREKERKREREFQVCGGCGTQVGRLGWAGPWVCQFIKPLSKPERARKRKK